MNDKLCFYMPPFPATKTYYDMIDAAVEYQLPGIEGFCNLDFSEPDIEAAKKIRAYADSKNVIFPCFSVYINLVGSDAEEQLQRLKGYAEVAAILGSPYLHHTIVNDFMNPDNVIPFKEEFFEKGIEAVREIYDYAENLGIRTIYEEQGYLFNGVENFDRFLHEVDRNIGIVADFANIYQVGDTLEGFIEAYAPRMVHAHIKDITLTKTNETGEGLKTLENLYMNAVDIGEGIIDFKKAITMLKNAGFNGYFGIEHTLKENDPMFMNGLLERINSWF